MIKVTEGVNKMVSRCNLRSPACHLCLVLVEFSELCFSTVFLPLRSFKALPFILTPCCPCFSSDFSLAPFFWDRNQNLNSSCSISLTICDIISFLCFFVFASSVWMWFRLTEGLIWIFFISKLRLLSLFKTQWNNNSHYQILRTLDILFSSKRKRSHFLWL